MSYRCPGQSERDLKVELHKCPSCGYEVEIFSDELKVTCPSCGQPVYKAAMPTCIDWCPAARECVGPERWEQLQEEKGELSRLKGAAKRPTEVLRHEHRLIERLLRVLEKAAAGLERGEEVSPEVFKSSLEFIRIVADRCHHGKEEGSLFPLLEQRGVRWEGGPLGALLQEHDRGRELVRGLAEGVAKYGGGDLEAREEIIENVKGYIQLLTQHIQKEDDVLFPIADHLLSQDEQQRLLEEFAEVEGEIGGGVHERFEELLPELEESLKVGDEPVAEKITADSLLGEVIKEYPQTVPVFKRYGMPDYAEERLPMETLSFFAGVHRVDLEKLLEELNWAVAG